MSKRTIYSNRVWSGGALIPASVTFEGGLITAVTNGKHPDAEDFGNKIIMPGILDAHVHINEPGRTDWEGFETATKAAAAGGVTMLTDMPLNASPVTTTLKAFEEKLAAANGKLFVHCGFYGGLIPGNLEELEPLMKAGVLGIKCFLTHSGIDEFPDVTEADIDAAMPVIAKYHIPLLAHCEISEESAGYTEDCGSYKKYLESRPKKWENDAIALMIKLCRKHRCKTHIVHVSSAEALSMIAAAKKEGLPLTAETCPHYIYFNAEDIPDNNTLYKCAPPIREKENNELLKAALKNGVLDFISTDHSPAPPDIKEIGSGDLSKAWGGIAGLQFLLPSSWSALKDSMSLVQFIPLLTSAPANFLGLQNKKGTTAAGFDADLTIWDPEEEFEITEDHIFHRHKISPYAGRKLSGCIYQTIVNGEIAYNRKHTGKKAGNIVLHKA